MYHSWTSRGVTPPREGDRVEILNGRAVAVRCEISRFSHLMTILYFFNAVKYLETSFNLFRNVFTCNYWRTDLFSRMLNGEWIYL